MHNERCPRCKGTIQRLLEKCYGTVIPNYRISLGTTPENYIGHPLYPALSTIFESLQKSRNYEDFVKADYIDADYYIPDPGFIVEFDESQHFTQQRKISLKNYPGTKSLGFSKDRWCSLCETLDKHDNDPPYRDEQRAWYDSLRDFLPEIKGFQPTVRLNAGDMEWCRYNPENPSDIVDFKKYLQISAESDIYHLIDALEHCFQEIKYEYLSWAKDKDNNGIGAPDNNAITIEFLKNYSKKIHDASRVLDKIRKECNNIKDIRQRYAIIREIYCIQPSLHELWFFEKHFNLFYENRLGGIYSRLGLVSIPTSIKNGTLDSRIQAVSTFMLKWVILLENLYSGAVDYSLFDFTPVNDEKLIQNIQHLQKNPNPDVKQVIEDLPIIYETVLTLLEKSHYQSLNPEIIMNDNKILLYAPCTINEGPIFFKNSNKSRVKIFQELGSFEYSIIRTKLADSFTILPVVPDQGFHEIMKSPVYDSDIFKPDYDQLSRINKTIFHLIHSPINLKSKTKKRKKIFFTGRANFNSSITVFEDQMHNFSGLKQSLERKDQCRITFRDWPKIDNKPSKSIAYEFNDWVNHGKPEISVEIQFWHESFGEIGEIIRQRKEIYAKEMPGKPIVDWDTQSSPGWNRLKFIFPDSSDPEVIAQCMGVLVHETKDVINDWLKGRGYTSY